MRNKEGSERAGRNGEESVENEKRREEGVLEGKIEVCLEILIVFFNVRKGYEGLFILAYFGEKKLSSSEVSLEILEV